MASIENMTDEEILASQMPGQRGYVMPSLRDPSLQKRTNMVEDDIDLDEILSKSMDAEPVYEIGEPDIEDGFVDRVVRGAERVGRGAKGVATGLGDLAYGAFEAKQKAIMDPAGATEEAKQFASRVMEGDPEAQEQALIATSMSMVEPAATGADVELARRDVRKAIETRDPGDIATAGISTVFAAIPIVGVGLTKGITKAAPDAPEPVFESVLEKAAVDKIQKKTGVDAIIPTLRSGGATKSEIADTKVPEFVEQAKAEGKKSVTKDELIKHLDENKVQIEEVKLGGGMNPVQERQLKVFGESLDAAHNNLLPEFERLESARKRKGMAPLGMETFHIMRDRPYDFTNNLYDQSGEFGSIIQGQTERILFRYLGQPNTTKISRSSLTDADIEVRPDLDIQPSDADFLDDMYEDVFEFNELSFMYGDYFTPERVSANRAILRDMAQRYSTGKGSDTPLQQKFVKDLKQLDFEFAQMQKPGGYLDERELAADFIETPAFTRLENENKALNEARANIDGAAADTQYEKITLPGGYDYQETLLKIPPLKTLPKDAEIKAVQGTDFGGNPSWEYRLFSPEIEKGFPNGKPVDRVPYTEGPPPIQPTKKAMEESLLSLTQAKGKYFKDEHWQRFPMTVAHIRSKTRIDEQGRKILFVEEIQSEWHQAGRVRGYNEQQNKALLRSYQKEQEDLKSKFDELRVLAETRAMEDPTIIKSYSYDDRENLRDINKQIEKVDKKIRKAKFGPVGDAPFKDTKEWASLSLRRVFRMAAEGGYDGVAFTRGKDIQAASGGDIKGQEYFYDKLLPSLAKKETKAPLEKTKFSSLSGTPRIEYLTGTLTGGYFDFVDAEYNMFLLTPKVKEKVSKPQKLYSLALPGIAVGAAAAEEEELSAAAALGALGMGGMALYKGARGARAAGRAADAAKTLKEADDALVRSIPVTGKTWDSLDGDIWHQIEIDGESRWIDDIDLDKATSVRPPNERNTGPIGVDGSPGGIALTGGLYRSSQQRGKLSVLQGGQDAANRPTDPSILKGIGVGAAGGAAARSMREDEAEDDS